MFTEAERERQARAAILAGDLNNEETRILGEFDRWAEHFAQLHRKMPNNQPGRRNKTVEI